MQPPKYQLPAYAALKSVTQEVLAADPKPQLPCAHQAGAFAFPCTCYPPQSQKPYV